MVRVVVVPIHMCPVGPGVVLVLRHHISMPRTIIIVDVSVLGGVAVRRRHVLMIPMGYVPVGIDMTGRTRGPVLMRGILMEVLMRRRVIVANIPVITTTRRVAVAVKVAIRVICIYLSIGVEGSAVRVMQSIHVMAPIDVVQVIAMGGRILVVEVSVSVLNSVVRVDIGYANIAAENILRSDDTEAACHKVPSAH
jgi:hypothetical protein